MVGELGMSRAQDIIEKLEKLDGQNNKKHDKYHNNGIPHSHMKGG